MASSRGAGPATPAPPDSPATKIENDKASVARAFWQRFAFKAAGTEAACGSEALILPDDECDDAISAGIEDTFRRKLAAIRRMPKRERPHARRAALEDRAMALLALKDKREAMRQFRRFLFRLHGLEPKG